MDIVSGKLPGWASVVIVVVVAVGTEAAEVFEDFGVEDGGTDFVDARGPLSEVDFAAAVAAEGEVFAVEEDEFAAGGTAEKFSGFFLWGHGIGRLASTPDFHFLTLKVCRRLPTR